MTYLWQLSDEQVAARRAEAARVSLQPVITRMPGGTITIYIPALAKLLDPHNVCLCPDCLLGKSEA